MKADTVIIFFLTLSTLFLLLACDHSKPINKVECPVIGIDLGTTYSCVGIYKNGRVEIIPNELGNRITPSVVAFTDEKRLIGEAAKNQATVNPTRTIYDIKRLLGRRFIEQSVQEDKEHLPYDIINKDNKPYIRIGVNGEDKNFAPEEISAMVLTKMKGIAEAYLGKKVKNAVVTVPGYFKDAQRQAVKDAGVISGLNVIRILNEPIAAAISYGLDKNSQQEKNILVFDLGGGTFDVSIFAIDNGVFEVLATNGDTHLGGEDFDQRVIDYFIKLIKKNYKKDISSDKRALQKLKEEVEKAKRTLSSTQEAKIEIKNLYEGLDISEVLTRARFEDLNSDLFNKTLDPIQSVLEDSGLNKSQIDEIVLVGGSTRIPKIRQLVKEFFNGKEPNTGINPDEAVAYGAAVQGGIICGEESKQTEKLLIIDTTPLSIGFENVGGVMNKIIPKGTCIPIKKTRVFSTYQDNQDTLTIKIFEGERPLIKDNHLLGKFVLNDIPPGERGVPQIEVTFEIDFDGILQVSAHNKGVSKSRMITITNENGRLSKEEIQKMLNEAEEFAEVVKIIEEQMDLKNTLDSYIHSMTNSIQNPENTCQ